MAKKDPTDLSVEERLKTLYQLQTTLSEIDEKRALRGELPLEVEDLEDEIAGLTTRIEKIQNDIDCLRRLSSRHWKSSSATRRSRRLTTRLKRRRPSWSRTRPSSRIAVRLST